MPGGDWCTVVGVVADVRHWSADVDFEPTAYYPYTQVPASFLPLLEGSMSVAVRSGNIAGLLGPIRAAVESVDKTVPVYDVKGMEQMVAESGSLRRFDMWLIGAFAGLALILATSGIYGVMAYSVSQRTREIGIRIALGAQQNIVTNMFVRHGLMLTSIGVACGLVAAFITMRLMSSLLFQVNPIDPMTYSLVSIGLIFTAFLASYLPSRRAATVDPVEALRAE
jgi:ABC-type antimicrobial peptide transport system permease subunit